MLEKNTEGSQIVRLKHKKVPLRDNIDHQPFKKTKNKQLARYCRDIKVKMEVLISIRGVCVLSRTV